MKVVLTCLFFLSLSFFLSFNILVSGSVFINSRKMTDRLQQAQENVEEVRDLMQKNYMKVQERGEKLEDLEEQAIELEKKGATFHRKTVKVQKKFKKKEKKAKGCLRVIVAAVLIVIIVAITIVILTVFSSYGESTSIASEKSTGDKETERSSIEPKNSYPDTDLVEVSFGPRPMPSWVIISGLIVCHLFNFFHGAQITGFQIFL